MEKKNLYVKIVEYLLKYRKVVFISYGFLFVLSIYFATTLKFYHNLERFFPQEDDDMEFLIDFQKKLEPDDGYMLIAVENKSSIFDSTFLAKYNTFINECKKIPHSNKVTSLVNTNDIIVSGFGTISYPILHIDNPEKYSNDSSRIMKDERFVGNFISKDAKILACVIKVKAGMQQNEAEEIAFYTDSLVNSFNFAETHVVSRAHTQAVFVEKIQNEMILFMIISIVLVIIILYTIYGRLWGIIIPLGSCVFTLILFMGLLGAIEFKLDLMSPLFPVLILIIGISDIIHIKTKYISERRSGHSGEQALKNTISRIGSATLLTSVTTAIGFLASLTSSLEPIRLFSVMAAVGVMLAYLVTITLSAILLVYFDANQLSKEKKDTKFWNILLDKIYISTIKYARLNKLLVLVAFIISVYGMFQISTNTTLFSDVPKDNRLRADFEFFENKLAGARPYEMAIIPQKDYKITDLKVLQETEKVQRYLYNEERFGAISSPTILFKSLNKSFNGGSYQQYKLPESEEVLNKYKGVLANTNSDSYNILFNSEANIGRITGRIQDIGSDSIMKLERNVENWINANVDTSVVEFRHTGTAKIIDKNNLYLIDNLILGLIIAFFGVGILMVFLFKNLRLFIVFFFPNIFPLLVSAAVMGYAGVEMKASTALIFMMAFGIAVDDTIHFLSQFKVEYKRTGNVEQSIRNTINITGKAIIITSVILFFGFISLSFSQFTTTAYIGILMSSTFISALLSEFYITPIFLRWFIKNNDLEDRLVVASKIEEIKA
jgi:predicted RND superfamily exporter protein